MDYFELFQDSLFGAWVVGLGIGLLFSSFKKGAEKI